MPSAADLLSIVVPAYNEERYIGVLLDKIGAVDLRASGLAKEIIVVDDGSTDHTAHRAAAHPGVRLERLPQNRGKGAAVRHGINCSQGRYLLIQDADLEYDPRDYPALLAPLLDGTADAVYGSRYLPRPAAARWQNLLHGKHPDQAWSAYLGGQSLSFASWALVGRYLTDTVTALKLFKGPLIRSLPLESDGFELDHEITARLLARNCGIWEVPIRYYPRTKAEGKKIGARDWFMALRTFTRYRRG